MAFPTESIEHIVIIWSMHLYFSDEINILESMGSKGN